MKKIIKQVLDELGDTQINLGSEASRETIASLLSAALKESGEYKEHSDSEIEEQEARKTWVCSICGKNTYDVDWDYIGSDTNHLGCELELGFQKITEDRREKNWSQKKHEEKVFNEAVFGDSKDLTEAKLDNHQLTNDREYPYNSFVRNKEEVDKLAEEIVSDNDTGYIYESPDGGKTVYKRKVGESERELVKDWKKINVRT